MAFDFDLFVIGAGSGGVRAARLAGMRGARVAIAEDRYLGGTCVNVGCVPKKLFTYAAHYGGDFEDAAGFGWEVGRRTFDWSRLIANKDAEIERLNGVYRRLLEDSGVTLIEGRARLKDPHTVTACGRDHSAERILIASGGWPLVPDIPAREHVITSNEAFRLSELPRRIVVVGGGYVAVEFASIFNGLGAEVSQLYRGPLFLRGFDDDVRRFLADEMRRKGVDLRFDANVVRIEKSREGLRAELGGGGAIEADLVMYATGRAPLTAGMGLEEAGVELDEKGAVVVDEGFRSSVPSVYALGDVIDRVKLTPVALAEATALVRSLFEGAPAGIDYDNIPTAVFSQPNVGTVGLSEAQARARHGRVDVYTSSFRPMKHTLSGRDERTFMKLVVERASDKVVGLHMVGPEAGEIVQGFAVALRCGATKAQFDATLGVHPTAAEEFVTMREKRPDAEG